MERVIKVLTLLVVRMLLLAFSNSEVIVRSSNCKTNDSQNYNNNSCASSTIIIIWVYCFRIFGFWVFSILIGIRFLFGIRVISRIWISTILRVLDFCPNWSSHLHKLILLCLRHISKFWVSSPSLNVIGNKGILILICLYRDDCFLMDCFFIIPYLFYFHLCIKFNSSYTKSDVRLLKNFIFSFTRMITIDIW